MDGHVGFSVFQPLVYMAEYYTTIKNDNQVDWHVL